MDESLTGPMGMFQVEGNTNGFPLNETDIEPVLTFYHTCDEDVAKVDKVIFLNIQRLEMYRLATGSLATVCPKTTLLWEPRLKSTTNWAL